MKKTLLGLALCMAVAVAQAATFTVGLSTTNDLGGFLSGDKEVPANSTTATGGEVGVGISYDTGTRIMDFNLAYGLFGFEPLTGDYTASHIHMAPPNASGSVVIDLAPIHTAAGTRAGFYNGTLSLTLAQETALFDNQLYVNIHSTTFPAGEIRAQLTPTSVPEPTVWALAGLGLAAAVVFRKRR